ncbi:unnamed protein product [Prunus armeniaca]
MLVGRSSSIIKVLFSRAKDWKRQEKRLNPLTRKDRLSSARCFSVGIQLSLFLGVLSEVGPKMKELKENIKVRTYALILEGLVPSAPPTIDLDI